MGKILWVNENLFGYYGYTEEEVVGENISILMSKFIGEDHILFMTKFIDTGRSSKVVN